MTQNEITNAIADIDKALASQYTPDVFKPKLQAKKKELQGLLTDTKRIDKKLTGTAAKKPEYKAQKKEVAKKVKTVKTDTKKLLADVKAQVAEFNKGRTKKALANDKKHTANKPGKHISAAGKIYYENRANRTDFNPAQRLESGGDITKYKRGLFLVDNGQEYSGYYIPGRLWNGWEIPVFEKEQALKILDDANLPYEWKQGKLFAALDSDWQQLPAEDQYEELGPFEININGDKIEVFSVGGFNWVWELTPKNSHALGGHIGQNTRNLFGDNIPVLKVGDKVTFDTDKIDLFTEETRSEDRNIRAYQRMVMANVNEIGIVKELGPGPGLTTVDYPDGWQVPMPTKYLLLLENFGSGGRLKSALMRDRKYTSQQEWEKKYYRKLPENFYKKENGGQLIEAYWHDAEAPSIFSYAYIPSKKLVICTKTKNVLPTGELKDKDLVFVISSSEFFDDNQTQMLVGSLSKLLNVPGTDISNAIENGNNFASGGRIKSALMRDRKYTNQSEPWEIHYNRKGKKSLYTRYKADGGPVDDDYYKNHTAAQLWDAWTKKQKEHFLEDHYNDSFGPIDVSDIVILPFYELQTTMQRAVEVHRKMGQYNDGGYLMDKGQNINVFGYPTINFDICPAAAEQLTESIKRINIVYGGEKYKEVSYALRRLAECVDEILGYQKQLFKQPLSKDDTDNIATNFVLCGTYTAQTDFNVNVQFLNNVFAEIVKFG